VPLKALASSAVGAKHLKSLIYIPAGIGMARSSSSEVNINTNYTPITYQLHTSYVHTQLVHMYIHTHTWFSLDIPMYGVCMYICTS